MKYQTFFFIRKTMKKYSRMWSAAVVIGALRVKMSRNTTKPAKWHAHPAKTQFSLGIHPMRSEFLLSARK